MSNLHAIQINTRRLRTAELSGNDLNDPRLMQQGRRYPNENKSLERNIIYFGLSFATLNQNQNNLYTAQLGR
jgi:hypothetical protein